LTQPARRFRRSFIAVEPDAAARAGLETLLTEIVRVAGDDSRALRLSRADNVHLTLQFLGNLDDDLEAAVRARLPAALSIAPFEIALGQLGTFPDARVPRVVWVDCAAGRGELVAVHRELTLCVKDAGVSLDTRPFTPHLTLARVRDGGGRRARRVADRLAQVRVPAIRWRVTAITRFHSDLSGPAPRYDAVQHVALRPPPGAGQD
jgi:2'-5' RNA ligase